MLSCKSITGCEHRDGVSMTKLVVMALAVLLAVSTISSAQDGSASGKKACDAGNAGLMLPSGGQARPDRTGPSLCGNADPRRIDRRGPRGSTGVARRQKARADVTKGARIERASLAIDRNYRQIRAGRVS